MGTEVEAVYESGILKLSAPLSIPTGTRVRVTVRPWDSGEAEEDPERAGWLRLSEQTLTRAWNNLDDDVFNRFYQE